MASKKFPCLPFLSFPPTISTGMAFNNRNRLNLDYDRFQGGIFNPSLVQHGGILWGIARCEQHNQAERNEDKSLNFTPTQAVLFKLNDSLEVTEAHYDVRYVNFPEKSWRAEDYRLFVYQNKLFCSHTLWVQGYNIGMALSQVDPLARTVTLIGPITIDGLKIHEIEKNWVMIPGKETLHCLYSFYPDFTLAELTNLNSAQFNLSKQVQLEPPTNGLDDKMVSLSTVPQRIGDAWYLLVHQKDSDHVYHDHLVRLNNTTLMPEVMSNHPVISGGDCEGFWRGYLTVYSMLIQDEQVIVSYGEGDRYSGIATTQTSELLAAL